MNSADKPPHCPSCGTDLEAVADEIENNTCPQCDRGLALPEDAVKTQLCVCCKIHEDDADESVEYIPLATGERLCSNCLADLRAFKFDLAYQVFTAEWLTDEHSQAISRAMFELAEEFGGEYTDKGNTNAAHGRMGRDPSEAIQARLKDLDEEQLAELRTRIEESGVEGQSAAEAAEESDFESSSISTRKI